MNVLHYYLGSKAIVIHPDNEWCLISLETVTIHGLVLGTIEKASYEFSDDLCEAEVDKDTILLVLKKPEDITLQDKLEYKSLHRKHHCGDKIINSDTPNSLMFAISKGYDMFELIDNRLAINEQFLEEYIKNLINEKR